MFTNISLVVQYHFRVLYFLSEKEFTGREQTLGVGGLSIVWFRLDFRLDTARLVNDIFQFHRPFFSNSRSRANPESTSPLF